MSDRHSRATIRELGHKSTATSGRQTRNSRAAGIYKAPRKDISVPERYKADAYKGTYGYERHHGSTRINKGRKRKIETEADHAPTDGSQRGALARDSKINRKHTLDRTAFSVPKKWHRLHPTTGSRDKGEMARAQRVMSGGYPHVGSPKSAEQRGRTLGFKMHLEGYGPIVKSGPKYGKGVFDGVKEGVSNSIKRMKSVHGISSGQVSDLESTSSRVFKRYSPRHSAGAMVRAGIFPAEKNSSSPQRGTKLSHYSPPSSPRKAWR